MKNHFRTEILCKNDSPNDPFGDQDMSEGRLQYLDAMDASQRAQLIEALIESAIIQVTAQLDGFSSRLAQALHDASACCTQVAVARLLSNASTLLRKNRYPFSYVVSESLRTVLQHEFASLLLGIRQRGSSGNAHHSGALKSLTPTLEVEKNQLITRAASVHAENNAFELAQLTARLATLFGRSTLEPGTHPLRPELFLNAVHDAWCEFHPDVETHSFVYPLLGTQVDINYTSVVHSANAVLTENGVPAQEKSPEPVAPVVDDPVTAGIRAYLADLKSSDAAGAQDDPLRAPALACTRLIAYLDSLHANQYDKHLATCGAERNQRAAVLAHVVQNAPADCISASDQKVITLLTAIFETALQNDAITMQLRTMIASLQIPVLQAALADHAFFFNDAHPVRRAMELLVALAAGWREEKGMTDPVYVAITRNIDRIAQADATRLGAFTNVVWDLEALIRREQTASDQILAKPIEQAMDEDRKIQAHRQAEIMVATRLEQAVVAPFVENFLETTWTDVLALSYRFQALDPSRPERAIKLMDTLLWSVEPKDTRASLRELVSRLPALIAELNHWLDLIDCERVAREAFFAELAECHAALVRSPIALTPGQQLSLAVHASCEAAHRRTARQQRHQALVSSDQFDTQVAALKVGAWIEYTDQGVSRRLKLAWVSPAGCLFIFTTIHRQFAFSVTDRELATALRNQQAHVIETENLVRRALAHVLAKEAANADNHAPSGGALRA